MSLLKHSDVLIGNTSSGIIEAPSLNLPFVSVGDRHRGRVRANNVIETTANSNKIKEAVHIALSENFRSSIGNNPYGDGRFSYKLADIISKFSNKTELLNKRSR